MGGVWKRQIRSFRNALNDLLSQFHIELSSYEAMNIVNSRTLTVVDPEGLEPLTPNSLHQLKTSGNCCSTFLGQI